MTQDTPSNSLLAWICAVYRCVRHSVKEIWQIVYLIRFSVALALIVAAFCVLPEQSRESFRKLSEDVTVAPGRAVWLFVGLISFVLASWYWSRTSINLLAPSTMKEKGLRGWCARNLPRLAAILPLLGAALACAVSASPGLTTYPYLVGAAILLLAVAAYFLFILRRRYLQKREQPAAQTAESAPKGFMELPRLGRIMLWTSLAISAALIILFSATPAFAWNFGSPAILMFWATTMVSIGTLLAIWGARYKFPIIGSLVVLGILFSWFNLNDNHEIRQTRLAAPAAPPDFGPAFEEWLSKRGDLGEYGTGKEYPVFIVAAQGGGIRAAYQTALALGRLQDVCPNFAQHLFAISGVSGGSLGAGIFAGLAEQNAKNGARQSCNSAAPPLFQDAADGVLKEDLLSPALAAALYPDLLQRMLPFPIGRFDRARGLETGFEQAWQNATQGEEFAQGFHNLAKDFTDGATPALFLNTTNVASGLRMVVAHLYPKDHGFGPLFVTEQDVDGGIDMPLSTAVGLSARFPIVTPAGSFGKEKKARFVDGGYYENSGTVTVQSMLSYFLRHRQSGLQPVRFVVITIGTDACVDERSEQEAEICRRDISPIFTRAGTGLGELLSPFRAIFNTRGGRGLGAVEDLNLLSAALRHQAELSATRGGFDVIPLEITRHEVAIPLGWDISAAARQAVSDQIGQPGPCPAIEPPAGKVDNSRSLGCIQGLLEGRF